MTPTVNDSPQARFWDISFGPSWPYAFYAYLTMGWAIPQKLEDDDV